MSRLQLLAIQFEFQVAFSQRLADIIDLRQLDVPWSQIITVPPPYSPSGIHFFELVVIYWVYFGLHRKAFVCSIGRGTLRHCPRKHHAIVF